MDSKFPAGRTGPTIRTFRAGSDPTVLGEGVMDDREQRRRRVAADSLDIR